jgi:hypothetical protein
VIAFVIAWNLLILLAIILNGGFGPIQEPGALAVIGITCGLVCILGLGIVLSPGFRRFVTVESRAHFYEPAPFLFIAAIAGVMAAFALGRIL